MELKMEAVMNQSHKILAALLVSLVLVNTPGLAFVCSSSCKSSGEGLKLCLKACAREREEARRTGIPQIRGMSVCGGIRVTHAVPALTVCKSGLTIPAAVQALTLASS